MLDYQNGIFLYGLYVWTLFCETCDFSVMEIHWKTSSKMEVKSNFDMNMIVLMIL